MRGGGSRMHEASVGWGARACTWCVLDLVRQGRVLARAHLADRHKEVGLAAQEGEEHVQQRLNTVAVGLAAHSLGHTQQHAIILGIAVHVGTCARVCACGSTRPATAQDTAAGPSTAAAAQWHGTVSLRTRELWRPPSCWREWHRRRTTSVFLSRYGRRAFESAPIEPPAPRAQPPHHGEGVTTQHVQPHNVQVWTGSAHKTTGAAYTIDGARGGVARTAPRAHIYLKFGDPSRWRQIAPKLRQATHRAGCMWHRAGRLIVPAVARGRFGVRCVASLPRVWRRGAPGTVRLWPCQRALVTMAASDSTSAAADATAASPAPRGAFILFEGVDRCGKTTQGQRLVETMRARGLDAEFLRFPGASFAPRVRNDTTPCHRPAPRLTRTAARCEASRCPPELTHAHAGRASLLLLSLQTARRRSGRSSTSTWSRRSSWRITPSTCSSPPTDGSARTCHI